MVLFQNKFLFNILTCGLLLSCQLHAATATHPTQTKPQAKESTFGWADYKFRDSGFKIEFPKKPEKIQQSIDIPKSNLKINYETYLSEPSDNVVFVVSVWNYPSQIDMSRPEVNLKDGFKGMLSALPGSEVISQRMTEVDGFKALEFLVKNEDIYFQGKLILVYNTLYQVFTVYKSTEDMTNNYTHFIDSFKLIDPKQHKVTPSDGKESREAKVSF